MTISCIALTAVCRDSGSAPEELLRLEPADGTNRATAGASLEFGRFRVLLRQRLLLADGAPIELGTFEILLAFLEANQRRLRVSRDFASPLQVICHIIRLKTSWPGKRPRPGSAWFCVERTLSSGTESSSPACSSRESTSHGILPSHGEKPAFSRRCVGPAGAARSAETGIAPTGGSISVGPNSSTAASMRRWLNEFRSGSGKAEHGPLLVPGKR